MSTSVCSTADLSKVYGLAGIKLRTEGVPLANAPPFGGTLRVGWTDNEFADVIWRERTPNPASGSDGVGFGAFPDHHAWTARFLIWALENASSSLQTRKARIRTAASARSRLSYFNSLLRYTQRMPKRSLLSVTQDDLREFMSRWCGLDGSREPVAKNGAIDMMGFLRNLHYLGPAHDHWIPDGLSFDPGPVLAQIVAHRDLKESRTTKEVDEKTAREITNTAIRWVEELGAPLRELLRMATEFEAWKGAQGKETSYTVKVEEYIGENPMALEQYKRLQGAFPSSLDSYRQYCQVKLDCGTNQQIFEAVAKLKQQELEAIAATPEPLSHKTTFSKSAAMREAGLDPGGYREQNQFLLGATASAWAEIEAALNARHGARTRSNSLALEQASRLLTSDPDSRVNILGQFSRLKSQSDGLVATMTGMCYIVVGVFTGWRVSEILSVETQFLEHVATGFSLGSKVRKTGVDPETVNHRPVPPIVAEAARLLMDINAKYFTEKEKRIFRNSSGTPADVGYVRRTIQRACGETGIAEGITSHQLHRFFAQFYVRRFQGNMDALRRNFRHVSRKMIWAYAQDAANAEYLAKEEKELAHQVAEGIVHGEGYKSRHVAQDVKRQYKALNLPPEQAERWLRAEIEKRFRSIHATPFGYCMFQRGDVGAACEAKDGPVLARAEPGTCGDCKFLVSGDENVGFWQATALLHQEIVDCPYHVPLIKEASRKMLKVCQAVLGRHGLTEVPEAEMEPVHG